MADHTPPYRHPPPNSHHHHHHHHHHHLHHPPVYDLNLEPATIVTTVITLIFALLVLLSPFIRSFPLLDRVLQRLFALLFVELPGAFFGPEILSILMATFGDSTAAVMPKRDDPDAPHFGGLNNPAVVCSTNAILQALAALKPFQAYLEKYRGGPYTEAVLVVLQQINKPSSTPRAISIPEILTAVLDSSRQQDSSEYYNLLMCRIEEEGVQSQKKKKAKCSEGLEDVLDKSKPYRPRAIENPVAFHEAFRSACMGCGESNIRIGEIHDVPVSLYTGNNLKNLLFRRQMRERTPARCNKCIISASQAILEQKLSAPLFSAKEEEDFEWCSRQLELGDFDVPDKAVLNLQRRYLPPDWKDAGKESEVKFVRLGEILFIPIDRSDYGMKITSRLEYPEVLDLNELGMVSEVDKIGVQPDRPSRPYNGTLDRSVGQQLYQLKAVVCHQGATPNSGHWVTFRKVEFHKQGEGLRSRWYFFSDRVERPASLDEVIKVHRDKACLLFYEKVANAKSNKNSAKKGPLVSTPNPIMTPVNGFSYAKAAQYPTYPAKAPAPARKSSSASTNSSPPSPTTDSTSGTSVSGSPPTKVVEDFPTLPPPSRPKAAPARPTSKNGAKGKRSSIKIVLPPPASKEVTTPKPSPPAEKKPEPVPEPAKEEPVVRKKLNKRQAAKARAAARDAANAGEKKPAEVKEDSKDVVAPVQVNVPVPSASKTDVVKSETSTSAKAAVDGAVKQGELPKVKGKNAKSRSPSPGKINGATESKTVAPAQVNVPVSASKPDGAKSESSVGTAKPGAPSKSKGKKGKSRYPSPDKVNGTTENKTVAPAQVAASPSSAINVKVDKPGSPATTKINGTPKNTAPVPASKSADVPSGSATALVTATGNPPKTRKRKTKGKKGGASIAATK